MQFDYLQRLLHLYRVLHQSQFLLDVLSWTLSIFPAICSNQILRIVVPSWYHAFAPVCNWCFMLPYVYKQSNINWNFCSNMLLKCDHGFTLIFIKIALLIPIICINLLKLSLFHSNYISILFNYFRKLYSAHMLCVSRLSHSFNRI